MQPLYQEILIDIEKHTAEMNHNEYMINLMKTRIKTESMDESEITCLHEDIEDLCSENHELRQDIAILEESLHKIDLQDEDTRSSSPYQERYTSWDEVFTGGDY